MGATKAKLTASVASAANFAAHAIGALANEFAVYKGNQLGTLIRLENSLSQTRDQLAKVASLIDSSLKAEESKRNSAGKASKLTVVLTPLQQFVNSIAEKLNIVEKDMRDTELSRNLPFGLILKPKTELSPEELKRRERFLSNPAINLCVMQHIKQPTARSSTRIQIVKESPRPSSASSCSVTELEDFVYNVLHGGKEASQQESQLANDVSLEDLLAASNNKPEEGEENVESPIATTTGCAKALEAVSRQPGADFDPKKVKKIEFSDENIKEHVEADSHLGPDESIDRIALNTTLRNQPDGQIMKYRDYVRQYNEERKKHRGIEAMLGSDVMSTESMMSSFDLPDEAQESYSSLRSRGSVRRNDPRTMKRSKEPIEGKKGGSGGAKSQAKSEHVSGIGIMKLKRKAPEEVKVELADPSRNGKRNEAEDEYRDVNPKSKREASTESRQQNGNPYCEYYTNNSSNSNRSRRPRGVAEEAHRNGKKPPELGHVKQNNSYCQLPAPSRKEGPLKRSKSIIVFEKETPAKSKTGEKSQRRIEKTKSVCALRGKKRVGEGVRLPSLGEDRKSHVSAKKLRCVAYGAALHK